MLSFNKSILTIIWSTWKHRYGLQRAARVGFGRCGITELVQHYDAGRPESVSEHCSTLMIVAIDFSVHYPKVLPPSQLAKVLTLLAYHDAAEEITGDTPDNGSRNELDKDRTEYSLLEKELLKGWPRQERRRFMKFFREFQEKSTPVARFLYCLDKLDAPLRALVYEGDGHPGSVFNDPNVTEMDKRYAALAGTGSTADVWGYHVLDRMAGSEFLELAYLMMCVAFEDVRGEVPGWLNEHYFELI